MLFPPLDHSPMDVVCYFNILLRIPQSNHTLSFNVESSWFPICCESELYLLTHNKNSFQVPSSCAWIDKYLVPFWLWYPTATMSFVSLLSLLKGWGLYPFALQFHHSSWKSVLFRVRRVGRGFGYEEGQPMEWTRTGFLLHTTAGYYK